MGISARTGRNGEKSRTRGRERGIRTAAGGKVSRWQSPFGKRPLTKSMQEKLGSSNWAIAEPKKMAPGSAIPLAEEERAKATKSGVDEECANGANGSKDASVKYNCRLSGGCGGAIRAPANEFDAPLPGPFLRPMWDQQHSARAVTVNGFTLF